MVETENLSADYDVVIVDITKESLTPSWVTSVDYLKQCKNRVNTRGVVVVSFLVKDEQHFATVYRILHQVFDGQVYVMSLPDHKNIIAFAFNKKAPELNWPQSRITELEAKYGIEFSIFTKRLMQDNQT